MSWQKKLNDTLCPPISLLTGILGIAVAVVACEPIDRCASAHKTYDHAISMGHECIESSECKLTGAEWQTLRGFENRVEEACSLDAKG